MCGIAGFFEREGRPTAERAAVLHAMTRTLVHRGPDGEGYHEDSSIALGHRRLGIIDLEGGAQPLANEDGTVWIAFNGEIYNYRDLTDLLTTRGHVFRTRSDTEVIVHAYEEWGVECLERLRGMFAFALWDAPRRRLVLARDRLGKKPLYYGTCGGTLVFGSELKALLRYPGAQREIDPFALSDYVSLGYVPAPLTILRGFQKLPAAHVLVADPNQLIVRPYWDIDFDREPPPGDPVEHVRELLREAVLLRLRSDVPLGAFLSGGLDSSAVVGTMARLLPHPVTTASIGFDEAEFNELPWAREVSRLFGTAHHEQVVTPDALGVLERLSWHFDEPFADSSAVPTYYVSALARRHVTVALSGDGGDESFAGYRRYPFDVRENAIRSLLPGVLGPLFGLAARIYPKGDYLPQVLRGKTFLSNLARTPWGAYYHSVSSIDADEKARLLSRDVGRTLAGYDSAVLFEDLYRRVRRDDPLARILYIDFKTWLAERMLTKVDRASMAHSLEVRCPLLDHRLVEEVAALPSALKLRGRQGKVILKEAVRDLLPDRIRNRRKAGFEMPVGRWLRGPLRDLVETEVVDAARVSEWFDGQRVARIWTEHRLGVRDRTTELWTVLMFNLWQRRFATAADRTDDHDAFATSRVVNT